MGLSLYEHLAQKELHSLLGDAIGTAIQQLPQLSPLLHVVRLNHKPLQT